MRRLLVVAPLALALGARAAPAIRFTARAVDGLQLEQPTCLQFGPDGRLYVSQRDARIVALTLERRGPGEFAVTASEPIDVVREIPNHEDDGTPSPVHGRQVTGLLVAGTPERPVIYAASADPRSSVVVPSPTGDTNGGVISRLLREGGRWVRRDLLRGLPRSRADHATNGLALDAARHVLHVCQGGNTNRGAPSQAFSFLPEYALSAAILSVDLARLGDTTHDLPTLDDEDRPNTGPGGADSNDPFGGHGGKNQARLVADGPVQVFASGFRNPYDLVLRRDGRIAVIDNGANPRWGGTPPSGSCSNEPSEIGGGTRDNLHVMAAPGFYGGHPNPARGSAANTWNGSAGAAHPSPAQSPVDTPNPVECVERFPGLEDDALLLFDASTNGITEYTASTFGGVMQGDLLAAGLDGTVWRIRLTEDGGRTRAAKEPLLAGFASMPLDVTAQGDDGSFPGTVWVAAFGDGTVWAFEPSGEGSAPCDPRESDGDPDGDAYATRDERLNGTNPCSPASVPADLDGDHVSDLADEDDDADGVADLVDPFALDAANGAATAVPLTLDWHGAVDQGGILGLGFTGVMLDGRRSWHDLFTADDVTAMGAAGKVTIDGIAWAGPAGGANALRSALQVGVVPDTRLHLEVSARIDGPFEGSGRAALRQGVFVGAGTQDDLVALVVAGSDAVEVVLEEGGAPRVTSHPVDLRAAGSAELTLVVDPTRGDVRPLVSVSGTPRREVGAAVQASPSTALWRALTGEATLAAGIVAWGQGDAPRSATWDAFSIVPGPARDAGPWRPLGVAAPTLRVDGASVVVAGLLVALGGRGAPPTDVLDLEAGTWQQAPPPPVELHGFQAVALHGLVWIAGAFTGDHPAERAWLFDPVGARWLEGPEIPRPRLRGATAAVAHRGRLLLVGGATGVRTVAWLDRYHPATGEWETLTPAPHPRAGFQAVVVGSDLWCAGGRVVKPSAGVRETDALDLDRGLWSVLPTPRCDVPTPRWSATTVGAGAEVVLIGGETPTGATAAVEAFDVVRRTWRSLAPLPAARGGVLAAACGGELRVVSTPTSGVEGGISLTRPGSRACPPRADAPTRVGAEVLPRAVRNAPAQGPTRVRLANPAGARTVVLSRLSVPDLAPVRIAIRPARTLPVVLPPGGTLDVEVTPLDGEAVPTVLLAEHSGDGDTLAVRLDEDDAMVAREQAMGWRRGASCPLPRNEAPSALVEGRLYVFGGWTGDAMQASTRVDAYDPAADTWSRRADMPEALTHQGIAVDGATVWLVGGFAGAHPGPPVSTTWTYDTARDAWSHGPALPAPRAAGALVRLGRLLHLVGGLRGDRDTETGEHLVLDLDGVSAWRAAAPLPGPRCHLSCIALGGLAYAIGGQRRHDTRPEDLAFVHAYDPRTDAWTARAPLPVPRSHFEPGTATWRGLIVIVGGRSNATDRTAVADVTAYDPAADAWAELTPLPEPLLAPSATVVGDELIVAGGGLHVVKRPVPTTRRRILAGAAGGP